MRLRVTFEKRGLLCFIPHVELPKLFCRSARRAGLKLQSTAGLVPRPKLSLGPALPMGVLGLSEPAEFWLESWPPEAMKEWNAHLPEGIKLLCAEEVFGKSLNELCTAAHYEIFLRGSFPLGAIYRAIAKNASALELLALEQGDEKLELAQGDPNRHTPSELVKCLVDENAINGWQDLLVVRRCVGGWDGERVRPLLG